MVKHVNNPLLDRMIHLFCYTVILLGTVGSRIFASDAAFSAKLDELVRLILSLVNRIVDISAFDPSDSRPLRANP
jgi:hypothetical protein